MYTLVDDKKQFVVKNDVTKRRPGSLEPAIAFNCRN